MAYIVVITGGLGAGKSTALAYLRELGAGTISADEAARAAVESPAIREALMNVFGDDLYSDIDADAAGELNRSLLASRAFVSDDARKQLNAIVHPEVERLLLDAISTFKETALAPAQTTNRGSEQVKELMSDPTLIIEIPLIEEVPGLLDKVDEVITITAPEKVRYERAIARGMSPEDARARIELQCDDDVRESHAQTVIENTGGEEEFKKKLREWWSEKHDN